MAPFLTAWTAVPAWLAYTGVCVWRRDRRRKKTFIDLSPSEASIISHYYLLHITCYLMKTCLFGGSFDPIHSGHLLMAAEAQRACGLDAVLFLPAARSPFKTGSKGLFSDAQRVELLRLALQDLPWAELSTLDLELPPPSWSWRVVEAWKEAHPQDELFWLMGTDQWKQLHRWARYEYLAEQLHFIVYARGEGEAALPQSRKGLRASFIHGCHPASSSAIREALLGNEPLPPGYLPSAVEEAARRMLKLRGFGTPV